MPNITLKTFLQEKHLWVLILVVIIYFHRPLFFGESFFFRDIISEDLPQKQFLVDSIRAKTLPLWDPSLFGGKPYFADLTTSTLNPLNLFYVFLSPVRAFTVSIIGNILGCVIFAYFAARIIGLHAMASLLVGVVYGFCGYSLSLANLSSLFFDMPYLPLLLACWHIFMMTGRRKWFLFAVIVGCMQIVNGSHEINAISLLLALGWVLVYPYSSSSFVKRIGLWILLGVFVAGVSACQILPAMEFLLGSSRGTISAEGAIRWSLLPQRIPEFIVPGFLMQIDPLQGTLSYWGFNLTDGQLPFILSIYLGGAVIMLTLMGGIRSYENRLLPYTVRVFLLSVIALSIVVSFGRFLPVVKTLYPYIARITLSRFPMRMLVATIFPIALLAGYSSEIHFGNAAEPFQYKPNPSSTMLIVFWSLWGFLLIVTMTLWLSREFADWFQRLFFQQVLNEAGQQRLQLSFWHASALWLLTTLVYQYRRVKKARWQHGMLACIVIVDLLVAGRYINPTTPEEYLTQEPVIVHELKNIIHDGRLFRTTDVYHGRLGARRTPSNDFIWYFRSGLEVLEKDTPALFGIPSIFHPDHNGLTQTAMITLTSLVNELPWARKLPLLSAGNVTAILTPEDLSFAGIRQVAEIPNRTATRLYLYHNETAAGHVTFVTDWKIFTSETDAIQSMLAANYDPRYHVALQASPATASLSALPKQPDADSPPIHSSPSISSSASGTFSVETDIDGFLVFSDPFYPGWHARLDGKPTPIIQANLAFSAVFVPVGKHVVERYYLPASLIIGAAVSLCFCVILGIFVSTGWLIRLNPDTP